MRTRDLDQAVEAVTRTFCPHTVTVTGRNRARGIDMRLEMVRAGAQPLVELSYGAPVKLESRVSRFLLMHCARGAAVTVRDGRTAEWRQGQTMPFSAGVKTLFLFDRWSLQQCTLLDPQKLDAQCARWLGRPLDRPLRFAPQVLSEELERALQGARNYLRALEASPLPLAPAAKAAFDDFLLTLLLHHHPHNYSEALVERVPVPVPGVVRQAERFMADNADVPITVGTVADHLGISLRTLQAGFRGWRNTTPSVFLRDIRLRRARADLLHGGEEGTVTTVALRYGFSHLGRFSAHYRMAFGELPGVTLRRSRFAKRA